MWLRGVLLAVLALHWTSIVSAAGGNKIVCYYGSWAVYRPGDGKFDVEDIDPNVCTHIIYGFVGINYDGTTRIMDSWNEVDKGALKRFSCLRKINPELKVLIASGGWNEGSTKYSDMAKDPQKRSVFINSTVKLLQTYDYDGFDLDWEYPNQRGGIPEDVQNFVQLLKELREEFKKYGYLLTAAVASANFSASLSYDIPGVSRYLDFINVMTYDLHGVWDGVTGHNSPLFPASHEVTDLERQLNVDACISFWIDSGAPPEKLILGIGLYGRTFTIAANGGTGLGVPAYSGGTAGPYTRESGYLGYNEICDNLQQGGWTVTRHPEQLVPYAVKGNQWVGYDDPESIAIKVEYALSRGLGGIMIWSFETDDFRAKCGPRNPLLNAIRIGLGYEPSYGDGWKSECIGQNNGGGPVVPPASNNICTQAGYVRDSKNCDIFYYCQVSGSSWVVHTFQCQSGLWYDPISGVCNWPQGKCGGDSDEEGSKEVDPGDVTEPKDPVNPVDPGNSDEEVVDPGDIATEPADPINPVEPGNSDEEVVDPGDVSAPPELVDPVNPTDPGNSDEEVVDPGDIDESTDPVNPTDPDDGDGGNVNNPDNPGPVVPPATESICKQVGYIRDRKNCAIFYFCEISGSSWRVHNFSCPSGLWFDETANVCNWPQGECIEKSDEGDDHKVVNPGDDSNEDVVDPGDVSVAPDPTDPGDDGPGNGDENPVNPIYPGNSDEDVVDPGDEGPGNPTDPGDDGPGNGNEDVDGPGGDDTQTEPGVNPGDGSDENRDPGPGDNDEDSDPGNPIDSPYKIVCYYGSWAVYRPGDGKFDVEDIDPFSCTHINFAFVGINNDGSVRVLDSWNEVDKAAFKRFTCLRKLNPDLKSLLAIGGWNEGSTKYSEVARDPNKRATFIKSAINFIEKYGFDGFDLDWEYPNQRGGVPADVQNFVLLVKEFREEFDKYGYLLTAAVASAEPSASLSYDIPEISKYLHFINVMTYDLHGVWDGVTGHNAPLFGSPDGLDVDTCISYWINSGAPPEKLILGIGTYGRTFTLANQNNNGIGAPIISGGTAGPYTRESGYLGYNEICVNFQQGGWTVVRHEEQKVPYAFKGNQWVGYDDPESILKKAKYVRRRKLGGIMVWSFETDDFRGACNKGRNPLLNAIRTGLKLSNSYADGWKSPCVNDSQIIWWDPGNNNGGGSGWEDPGNSNPSIPPPPDGICSQAGYVRDPENCAIYYHCQINGSTWRVTSFQCVAGTYYDTGSGNCDWADRVSCP